jgi:uncharacterized protein
MMSREPTRLHVTVIAKTPTPGKVKTRLCPPCTYEQAAQLAEAALADTFDAIDHALDQWTMSCNGSRNFAIRRVILLDGEPVKWFPTRYDVVAQSNGDLGDRLTNGFGTLGPGIIVAMDSPFAAHHVAAALDALIDGHDAIGMTDDGGYWGIALATISGLEFTNVPMSTDHTGVDQLRRLHELGRIVVSLPSGQDIDTFDDVVALANSDHAGRTVDVARALVAAIDLTTNDGERSR